MRRPWLDWPFIDRFGAVITITTGLALIGLVTCTACNDDDGTPVDRLIGNTVGPTLPPLTSCPAGVDGPQFECWLRDHPEQLAPMTVTTATRGSGTPAP